jgi:uncharacterized membrane protein YkvA (DUF1232 family)
MAKSNERTGAAGTSLLSRLRESARKLKLETRALLLAYRDPRTPWYAKAWAVLVLAYAFSPIDLIPDFIPILGYLDDLLLVPAGVALALKLVPSQVMAEAREKACQAGGGEGGLGHWGAAVIAILWLLILVILCIFIVRLINR